VLRLNIAFDEVQRTRAFHRSALPTRMKGAHALGVAKLLPFAIAGEQKPGSGGRLSRFVKNGAEARTDQRGAIAGHKHVILD